MTPRRVTGPAVAVIPVEEMKAHLRVVGDDETALIAGLVAAAEQWADGWSGVLGRALITQTWELDMPEFPGDAIRIPLGPVQSIVSVKYHPPSGAQQTADANSYRLHEDSAGHYIRLVNGAAWPSTDIRDDAVTIRWVAGFGDTPGDVPQNIRVGLQMMVAHMFENREAVGPDRNVEMPFGVSALVFPARRMG